MSTTIAAVAGTTSSGLGNTRHVIYGVNSGYWWAFAFTGTNVLSTYYSSDNSSWSAGAFHTLAHAHQSEGRNLSVAYKTLGSYDVVHIAIAFKVGSTQIGLSTIRATIVGTTLTFHSSETVLSSGGTDSDSLFWAGTGIEFESSNKIHIGNGWANGSDGSLSLDDSTADAGTAEQMTPVTYSGSTIDTTEPTETRSGYIVDLGATKMGYIADNGATVNGTTGLEWATLTSGTWSVSSTGNTDVTGSISSIDRNDWAACTVNASDIHVVYRTGSNSFVHRRYNGASWVNGQTIPNQTSLGGGGIALTTDGVSLWMSVIDTDAPNTIRTLRWSSSLSNGLADAWDTTWNATETSSQTRTWIGSPRDVAKQVALVYWAEGSNLVAATFVAVSPPDPPWIQTAQGSTAVAALTFPVTFVSQNIAAGNRIIVCVSVWNGTATTVTSVTDTPGNIYLKDSATLVLSDGTDISIWSAPITVGAGTKPTVTAHASASSAEWSMYVHEYAVSNALTNYTDGIASTAYTSNPSPVLSGASSPAPQSSGELALGYYGDGGDAFSSITPSAGWTQRGTTILSGASTEGCVAEQFTSAGVGSNASFVMSTTGTVVGACVVVYKLAPAGVGYGAFDPNLNPLTMPGSPYAQMIWVAPAFLPAGLSPATVGMILQAQRRRLLMLASQRRSRVFTALADVAVPQPSQRRIARAVQRRQRPPALPPPVAAPSAPTYIPGPSRSAARARPGARRPARLVPLGADGALPQPPRSRSKLGAFIRSRVPNVIPWYQANPNTNQPLFVAVQNARRRPWLAWLRRVRASVPPLGQDPPAPPQRQRARLSWLRRSRVTPTPLGPDLVPVGARVRRALAWARRVRLNVLPILQAAAAPNPTFIDVHRRLIQRYWTRPPHGRTQEPPWGQATAAPNPAFTDWVARRFRWWPRQARAAQQTMPWTQPAVQPPPIVVPPARVRRPWLFFRSRRPAPILDTAQGLTSPSRRRAWPSILRSRRQVIPSEAAPAPTVAPRRRTLWPWRSRRQAPSGSPGAQDAPAQPRRSPRPATRARRPLFAQFPWPQAASVVPLQPIALAIYTRSMAVVAWTRQAASITIVTRSMAAVVWTRDMALKIITRSESTRTNTRG